MVVEVLFFVLIVTALGAFVANQPISVFKSYLMWQVIFSFILGAAVAALVAWRLAGRWARHIQRLDNQLLRRTRRAEKLAELGVLTGHLAHEIRNPLSTIKMNLRLLAEDLTRTRNAEKNNDSEKRFDSDDKIHHRQLRKLETLEKETDRLAETLNDFLRYAGRIELHQAHHNINELLDDLMDFYEPQAASEGVRIRRSLSSKPLVSRVDADLLKQAFLNLFINATQAMESGGELMVRTKDQGADLRIDIIDTGPGIDPAQQQKIFDAYYTSRPGGTGLGLPTCRRIFEEHGGLIELHSEPGKGSNFVITLPQAQQK